MTIETAKWDMADYIKSPEDELARLEVAFEDGDASVIAAPVGAIARGGMTAVAKGAGITRDALYKSLVADGDPRLSTVLG
jgi:probable addiction module antidote protein